MISTDILLLTTLVLYGLGWFFFVRFDKRFLWVLTILWFIPLTQIDNEFVKIFSVAMIILHIALPFFDNLKGSDL